MMGMMISVVSITAFVLMTGYILIGARFAATRKLAAVSAFMAAVETIMFGMLSCVNNPTAFLLLLAARAAVLVACAVAMHRDREEAKARKRLRNRFRVEMYNTREPLHVERRQRAAARIDIVA